ncbi:hypothetical protein ACFX2A_045467 [Malus domestica]
MTASRVGHWWALTVGFRSKDLLGLKGHFRNLRRRGRSSSSLGEGYSRRARRNFRVSVISRAEGIGNLRENWREWEER